ncbi:MAG TPA: hypothetical protein VFW05_10545 [Verrucomicrobiae bacterium]|nr:hypothetical protein [Verrucomicrobiae bacterium]
MTSFNLAAKRLSPRRAGMALIVTLIMLSVITFMTVTFLVLSQRERGSVTTSTDQLLAKQAADSGLERAKIEMLAPMLELTNSQLYGMVVSTNFINENGFDTSPPTDANSFTNVSYVYKNGTPVSSKDELQVLANLMYNPRPPVFVTNRNSKSTDFRYYLDLNRNGAYDGNGFVPETDFDGKPVVVDGVTNYLWQVGDPEWIGILERPELPHSSSNRFIGRYAYAVVPAGKTLDVNYIHNQAASKALTTSDGFFRNQGIAPWEINLAAFLTDLNTNIWGTNAYTYRQPNLNPPNFNVGIAFDDARSFLSYRYDQSYGNLFRANDLFAFPARFQFDNIDQYSDGTLVHSNELADAQQDDPSQRWVGSDNPVHFFNPQEFFDRNNFDTTVPLNFADRLNLTGTPAYTNSSYDRYTYYRMLEQLGTDSEPDRRMNLNYVNLDASGRVIPGMETNMIHWTPLQFFTNAADRLIRAQFPNDDISITNIPVFQNNTLVYSPVVNRLLQLAANMYEATTNTLYPTLFRPLFSRNGTNVFISSFTNIPNPVITAPEFAQQPIDLNEVNFDATFSGGDNVALNIYGVPWIIGVRKGLPNLNEVTAQSVFDMIRRIQVSKASVNADPSTYTYQQEYLMDIYSALGVEAWNSYHTNFPFGGQIYASGRFSFGLTNNFGYRTNGEYFFPSASVTPPPNISFTTNWPGYGPATLPFNLLPADNSFYVPLRTNFVIVPPSIYNQASATFYSASNTLFEPLSRVPVRWGLFMTNRLRVILCDSAGRVYDYVQLRGPSAYRNLSEEIRTSGYGFRGLWNTNLTTSPIMQQGVQYQLQISLGQVAPTTESDWKNFGIGPLTTESRDAEIQHFRDFYYGEDKTNLVKQVPYTPMRTVVLNQSWQANDPLVHYTADDLNDLEGITGVVGPDIQEPPGPVTNLLHNIGKINERYNPWLGNPHKRGTGSKAINFALKDPLVEYSDDWDFPTNKFANIGWLGRVHRGTPWQTVYMKSADILNANVFKDPPGPKEWQEWIGYNAGTNAAPSTDRLIFDLFTAAPNENAGHGRLPINQENLAAWSAVLSGVVLMTNAQTGEWTVIQPAAFSTNVQYIVDGINTARANTNIIDGPVFPNQQFAHLGDILSAPQLTDQSPYLPVVGAAEFENFGINDTVMERIPQQIMSLLSFSHSPRFVIYSYGQTLRPAEGSVIRSFGQFYGMCTNYQITAETATRAVVRVEGSLNPADRNNSDQSRRYPPRIVVEQFNLLPPD